MSDNGEAPKLRKVVGNGPRMVAGGCQEFPKVPVDLKPGLQTTPRQGGAAHGQIRRNWGPPPSHQQSGVPTLSSTVGSVKFERFGVTQLLEAGALGNFTFRASLECNSQHYCYV